MSEFIFDTLYNHENLLLDSVKFLNQEWHRSDGSREHSQSKSCRPSPPMSFILLEKSNNELAGHARVCLLPNRPTALWIESVLIRKDLRGRGLGRKLMLDVEKWMIQNHFDEAFLCTEDQVDFYLRCGYSKCQPIVHSTTSTSVFPAMEQFQQKAAASQCSVVVSPNAPPPPPPPTSTTPRASAIGTINHQYMNKKLI